MMETAPGDVLFFMCSSSAGCKSSLLCRGKEMGQPWLPPAIVLIFGSAVVLAVIVNPLKEYLHARVPTVWCMTCWLFADVVVAAWFCAISSVLSPACCSKNCFTPDGGLLDQFISIQGRIYLIHAGYWTSRRQHFSISLIMIRQRRAKDPARAIYLSC